MQKNLWLSIAITPLICSLSVEKVFAQKWADLTMTVLLDGEVPERKALQIPAGANCGRPGQLSDNLIIDPVTKGIANVVFMIDGKKTNLQKSQFHPSLQNLPAIQPVLDNANCMFEPHVMAVRASQTIEARNLGNVGHNAHFSFFANAQVNPMIAAGGKNLIPTKVAEKGAVRVDCNIHPWMSAFVFVLDHPYIGISDTNGKITIEKLPAGIELSFKIWHESQSKSIEPINLNGKSGTWSKGTVKLMLKEGSNDLGVLLLEPERFHSL